MGSQLYEAPVAINTRCEGDEEILSTGGMKELVTFDSYKGVGAFKLCVVC